MSASLGPRLLNGAIWGDTHAEAVARFSNNSPRETSVHVHGQYSKRSTCYLPYALTLTNCKGRSPFDGWAADTSQPGQYKVFHLGQYDTAYINIL